MYSVHIGCMLSMSHDTLSIDAVCCTYYQSIGLKLEGDDPPSCKGDNRHHARVMTVIM
jgi:hypothetical protein